MSGMTSFYSDIRKILEEARKKAYLSVNFAMIEAYWKIGQRIVKEEQKGKERAEYGEYLIKSLSKELTDQLGKGFSVANLKNCRQFYLIYPDLGKGYTLRSELSWSHYRLIMRVDNAMAREYYMNEAADQNWSTRQLERNISTLYYERLLSSKTKNAALKSEHAFEKQSKHDFIKDPYMLEFLQMPENPIPQEKDVESAIISNLSSFLLEMGKEAVS